MAASGRRSLCILVTFGLGDRAYQLGTELDDLGIQTLDLIGGGAQMVRDQGRLFMRDIAAPIGQ